MEPELIGGPAGELRYVSVIETVTYRVPIIYVQTMSDAEVGDTAIDAIANADEEESRKWVVAIHTKAALI